MAISPRFLDELRSRITLSDIIGKRVRLHRAGREFKACCPFHNEKTPSFYVNDVKAFYHCFGCGAHGDAIGFLMQHDNLSFIDAVESLASLAGMQVPAQTPQERQKAAEEKSLYSLMDDAARYMESVLRTREGVDALSYLHERGVNDAALSAFRIGFAPQDDQALASHLRAKGYTDAQMREVDLLRSSSRAGGRSYAFFRDRIIFPVCDRRGRVVAFGGRILPAHLRPPSRSDFTPPKYMNSADTPIFHKGNLLYGEPHARQAAGEGQTLVVVEGYLDVMACVDAGFRGALAPLGTALTEEQIQIMWSIVPAGGPAPVLCFDGDEAGRRAASRAAERILPMLGPDRTVRVVFLPDGEDPDTLIRSRGAQAFQAVLDGAMSLSDFIWAAHVDGRRFDTPESRAGLAQALEQEAMKIADRNLQSYYRESFRQKISETFWQRQSRGGRSQARAGRGKTKGRGMELTAPGGLRVRSPAHAGLRIAHAILLAAAVNHPEILESAEDELMALEIDDPALCRLREAMLGGLQGDLHGLAGESLRRALAAQGFEEILDKLCSESIYIHAGFARPGAEKETVLEKWRETYGLIHLFAVPEEIRKAGGLLATDVSEDNFNRIRALSALQDTSEG
jgi:DNA primase